jgi:purine-binding chemotaxis protein CheW
MESALVVKTNEIVPEMIQLVTFLLGEEEYGVNVLNVREIIRLPEITRVPNTPHYVEGVINLRGKVIPVMSMRKRFGLDLQEFDNRTRVIVMEFTDELMGFLVDAVSEVIRISPDEIQPPPAAVSSGVDQACMAGVINQAERLIILLELEKISIREDTLLLGH